MPMNSANTCLQATAKRRACKHTLGRPNQFQTHVTKPYHECPSSNYISCHSVSCIRTEFCSLGISNWRRDCRPFRGSKHPECRYTALRSENGSTYSIIICSLHHKRVLVSGVPWSGVTQGDQPRRSRG